MNALSQARRFEIEAQAEARDDRQDHEKLRDAVRYVLWNKTSLDRLVELAPVQCSSGDFNGSKEQLEAAYSDLVCLIEDLFCVPGNDLKRALSALDA